MKNKSNQEDRWLSVFWAEVRSDDDEQIEVSSFFISKEMADYWGNYVASKLNASYQTHETNFWDLPSESRVIGMWLRPE